MKKDRQITLALMFTAVLVIGGFLYWLNVSVADLRVAIAENEETVVTDPDASATRVPMSQFGITPVSYVGSAVRIENIRVLGRLGGHLFWTPLPNENPYLVRIGSDLVAEGLTVGGGDQVTIVGMVHLMTDSVLDQWEADGILTEEIERIEASFATSFIEASYVEKIEENANRN